MKPIRPAMLDASRPLSPGEKRILCACAAAATVGFLTAASFTLIYGFSESFQSTRRDALFSEIEAITAEHSELNQQVSTLLASLKTALRFHRDETQSAAPNPLNPQVKESLNLAWEKAYKLRDRSRNIDRQANLMFSDWKYSILKVSGKDNRKPLIVEFKTSRGNYRKVRSAVTMLSANLSPIMSEMQEVNALLRHDGRPESVDQLADNTRSLERDLRVLVLAMTTARGAARNFSLQLPTSLE